MLSSGTPMRSTTTSVVRGRLVPRGQHRSQGCEPPLVLPVTPCPCTDSKLGRARGMWDKEQSVWATLLPLCARDHLSAMVKWLGK